MTNKNSREILQKATEQFMKKNNGNSVEDLAERRMDEQMDFYERALRDKVKFSVVFNKMRSDGTLICVGEYVNIILRPQSNKYNQTFAERLNRAYNVVVSEIEVKEHSVVVELATEFTEGERNDVMREIKSLYTQAAGYVMSHYEEEIMEEKKRAFHSYCLALDPEKDSQKIDHIMKVAEDRGIGNILEKLIAEAYYKEETGEVLSEEERLFADLVLPAKVYSIRPKNSETVKAAVDLVGMRIGATILPKHWLDRYTDVDLYRNELSMLIGSTISVAVIGYNSRLNEYICSRRAISASIWDTIDDYFAVGDIVQIRCINTMPSRFFGRIVGGVDEKEGNTVSISEFQGVSISCDYPNSQNAIRNNMQIRIGGIYLGKIRRIDKEHRIIFARSFRESGKWIQTES